MIFSVEAFEQFAIRNYSATQLPYEIIPFPLEFVPPPLPPRFPPPPPTLLFRRAHNSLARAFWLASPAHTCNRANDPYSEITMSCRVNRRRQRRRRRRKARRGSVLARAYAARSLEARLVRRVHSLFTYLGQFAQPSRGLDPPRNPPRLRQTHPLLPGSHPSPWERLVILTMFSFDTRRTREGAREEEIRSAELKSSAYRV